MLTLLTLKNFVIVENLTVEPQKGLTCLTGETGAGKSILIDALDFVLGARSDIGLIRDGKDKTDVAAEFEISDEARAWLRENDFEDTPVTLLRRTVDQNGRSHCWINGTSSTVGQVKDFSQFLIDIHGQNAHQSLLKPAFQLRLVDDFGKTEATREKVKTAWDAWQHALELLNTALNDQEKLQTEKERLLWINETLEELNPKEGEWESLSNEHKLLSNAADITTNVRGAVENLADADVNAQRLLALSETQLTQASKYDSFYEDYAKALNQASTIVEETLRDISRHLEHCNLDEERFSEIDERLNSYWRLSRKFHRSPEEIVVFWDETKERLRELESSSDIESLKRNEKTLREVYMQCAHVLTQERQVAAQELSLAVTEKMQTLAMAGGKLEVSLPAAEPWAEGLERCEFLVAGHEGATPRALNKVASGGELARISLAIAVITATITPVPTLIFDEVDTGIGGAVAEVVGHLLNSLGKERQVLCITHLPQVAACGDNQWKVLKKTENGVTTSHLAVLTQNERVDEIARMLSGLTISDTTKAAAAELLEQYKKTSV